jgi:hypothetical protein
VAPVILVPFNFVTPVVVDQYTLYEVAPKLVFQEIEFWALAGTAAAPVGATGIVTAGDALACAESTDSPALFTAVTT